MPILDGSAIASQEVFPKVHSKPLVRKEVGAVSLTVNDMAVAPGASIPLHIHPTHEEAIVVLEGAVEATLGDEVRTLGPGHTILAPKGVKHMLANRTRGPARVLAIFPTTDPQRQLL
ncbi:MAG: cupin domain-containing protein [Chloroflexi bacterium]|nr:cupin domain-containing protein [Chloroflexota bacterium]